MGKASRWFRSLFAAKKTTSSSDASKEKKKWGFVRGSSYAESSSGGYGEAVDANKHAIAVAAATAAVAEAALAAAHAAAEVVRLTSGGGSASSSSNRPATAAYGGVSEQRRREVAVVKIQSAFRAYLARRALRALKGLVRLQALVRGHIVRKQSADMLRRMQAMARIQARACSNRANVSESSQSSSKSSNSCHPDTTTPKKYGKQFRAYSTKSDRSPLQKSSLSYMKIKEDIDLERTHFSSNWLDRWMEEHPWSNQGDTSQKSRHAEDERSDKILEVDTWKPHPISKQGSKVFRAPFDPLPRHPTKPQKQNPSISSGEVLSLTSLKFSAEVDQGPSWARENSPQKYSASSRQGSSGRRGPFTPTRSECSKSLFGDYMGYPNYMANTESSWAKVRSQSAPRQRIMQLEKPASLMRFVRGYWDGDSLSERGLDLCEDFSTKAYPGSAMPVRGNSTTMGTGLIPADGETWRVRRRAIVPALHQKYVAAMISLFGQAADRLCQKLDEAASNGEDVEMESLFSRLTLDIIGKAVFNYDFNSLTNDTGIVEAVYTVLREAEDRSVQPIPFWEIPIWKDISPKQKKVNASLKLINEILDNLIAICKRMVEEEELQFHEDYMNEQDPSILHFLLASGDDVSSKQLRDDLMTMLIAGHETSAAVLTWTFYLLSQEPSVVCKLQNEVDSVLGDRFPTIEDMKKLKYTTRVINESLRLYPQPPVLIRRSLEDDILGKYPIKRGEDIFISIWNLHRCPKHWEDADKFNPERWPLDGPNPNETNQNFSYLPFGGGPRKCVGDMFASYETVVAVAMLVQRFNFEMALEAPRVEMTTGATIHTTKGLKMRVTRRIKPPIMPELEIPVLNVNSVGLSEVEPELAQRGEVSAANS